MEFNTGQFVNVIQSLRLLQCQTLNATWLIVVIVAIVQWNSIILIERMSINHCDSFNGSQGGIVHSWQTVIGNHSVEINNYQAVNVSRSMFFHRASVHD